MRWNRLVMALLEGRAHRLLPRGLTVLSYTGPVSGRTIRLPVQSVVDGNRFLAVAGRAEKKRWWRAFRRAHPAELVRGGTRYDVIGRILSGPQRSSALTIYLVDHPSSRHGVGLTTPVISFEEPDE